MTSKKKDDKRKRVFYRKEGYGSIAIERDHTDHDTLNIWYGGCAIGHCAVEGLKRGVAMALKYDKQCALFAMDAAKKEARRIRVLLKKVHKFEAS